MVLYDCICLYNKTIGDINIDIMMIMIKELKNLGKI